MTIDEIEKVLIIGSGTMGQQISVLCALAGYEVTVYDIKKEFFETAKKRIGDHLSFMVSAGKTTQAAADKALERIYFTTDSAEAAKDADIVSESIPEIPSLKAMVFAKFNKLCPDKTVFTTNTSSLLPSMFANATGRPERFIALHFHDIRTTDIVDVMPHSGTTQHIVHLVRDFALKIHQRPIVIKKENVGYVFNQMLLDLCKSAQSLASKGVASVEDIDRAWMGVTHMDKGPFGMMDSIGIDTCWKVTDFWALLLKDKQLERNAAFLKEYVDRGDLGQKTSKGFYRYPNPTYSKPEFSGGEFT